MNQDMLERLQESLDEIASLRSELKRHYLETQTCLERLDVELTDLMNRLPFSAQLLNR